MQIDIVSSIILELFTEVMEFAKSHVSIDDLTMDIIINARKSILSHENSSWAKTSGDFDTTMGSFDGAEDFVGIYILYGLSKKIPEIELGLYRDDELGVQERITKTKLHILWL